MTGFLPIIIVAVFLSGVVVLILLVSAKRAPMGPGKKKLKMKNREVIIKESTRRLAQNPKDSEALLALGDLYYREETWAQAMKTYAVLIDVCGSNPDLDEFEINMRYGLSAVKSNRLEDAYKGLLIAHTLKNDNFEVNYNLGYLEYLRKNYDKAVQILKLARKQNPDHVQTVRYLGMALFKLKNFKDALVCLKKAVDLDPDDKDALFIMGQCYFELGSLDNAIKLFTHLRADPQIGPSAALFAGTIHLNQHQYPKAIMDFEIGLKHTDVKQETLIELKYRLAAANLKQQEIGKALQLLNEIQAAYPNYKDVVAQIQKYQELNANKNLQVFLLSPPSDFVVLCRRIVEGFFPRAKVKIIDISVQKNEYADILAEVETSKWEDLVQFRFVRTTGQIGELILREFHAKIKETKAGKGYCMTTGTFTDEAKKFVEARLIDLIEKDRLVKILNSVDSGVSSSVAFSYEE